MSKKIFATLIILFIISVSLSAEETEAPEAFSFILGPRVGCSCILTTEENFTSSLTPYFSSGNYFPVITLFGVNFEQRILLGETRSHFAFQEVVLLGGLEQGMILPEATLLIGYRDSSGFEFGIGPILHLSGIGVITAVGWTFSYRGVYIPVDISLVLPNKEKPIQIGFTTGFNFLTHKKEPEDKK
jgi:hypothetical protein